jgi:hypothetical protein
MTVLEAVAREREADTEPIAPQRSPGVGLPHLPCDRDKCQVCAPEKVVMSVHFAKREHAYLKAESRRLGMTLTAYLRELIRADMRSHGKKP